VLTTRVRWADPPVRVRWESARLAEPLVLRRPWHRPWLERPDGTALPVDGSGARCAEGADGRPVRVAAVLSYPRLGWRLEVDGRPVPSTAPVGPSAALCAMAGLAVLAVVTGVIGAQLGYLVCYLAVAVRRCEGDRATRRRQAAAVALAGTAAAAVVLALAILATRAVLGPDTHFLWGVVGAL
jgi:hypothetical protein